MGENGIPISNPSAADLADLFHSPPGVLNEAVGIAGYGLPGVIDLLCLILHHHSDGIGEGDGCRPGLEEQVCSLGGLLVEVIEALRLDGESILL